MDIKYNTSYQLKEIINKIRVDKIYNKVFVEINRYVIKKLPYPNISQENYVPETIEEHLSNLRKLLEEKSKQISNIFSYYEWLYHLRRLPPEFYKGRLKTTFDYDMSLAIHIASFSKTKTTFLKNNLGVKIENNRVITLDAKKVRYILRFIFHIKSLSHIDVLIRRISKGVKLIKKSKHDYLPIEVPNQYIQESISIYDKRMASVHGDAANLFSRTGLSIDKLINNFEQDHIVPEICFINNSSFHKYPITLCEEGEKVSIAANYLIHFQEYKIIHEYLKVINSNEILDLQKISIIAIFLYLAVLFIIDKNINIISFYQTGYVLFNKSSFEKFTKEYFDNVKETVQKIFFQNIEGDYQVILSKMKKRSILSYPFDAPGYFEIGYENQICIDLLTCTKMLHSKLEHKVTDGTLSNTRALHFEKSLQKLIDFTQYQPDNYIKRLINQKSINFNSKKITDIDAAFVYNNTLILVSAKSYIYNAKYDKGNYRYIRNTRDKIEKDIQEWREKIRFLNKNITGDNYDLSSYGKVQGIVCTPSLFFIGANYYKSKISCGIDEYQSAVELYRLLTSS